MLDPFYICWIEPTVLGVENAVSVLSVEGDTEPHIFNFWDADDVRNPFLVDPTRNETKYSLIVGGSGTFITMPKQPSVTFSHVCEKLFIVHPIVRGALVQVYPGGVYLFTLLSLLVQQLRDSVVWVFFVFDYFTNVCVEASTLFLGCT